MQAYEKEPRSLAAANEWFMQACKPFKAMERYYAMKVLVTGGAGFIGTAMCRGLLEKGLEVALLDLPGQVERNRDRVPSEAVVFECSIMDKPAVEKAVRDCDYVVHLAAMLGVRKTEWMPVECLDVNIEGTRNVLDACRKTGVKKIVFSSSSEVYGEPVQVPMVEDDLPRPKSVYGVSKLVGEKYVEAYGKEHGLNYSIVRFFNVYGPGQVAEFVLPKFVLAAMNNKPLRIYGDGMQVRAFCYVDDAVEGASLALLKKEGDRQVFNIGNDSEPVTVKELAEKVLKVTGGGSKLAFVEMSEADRSGEREIQKRIPDISKARRMLGYSPRVSLEEGIKRMVEYGKINETPFS